MTTAKVFQHGGSQAIRLPKSFRFEGREVLIERNGEEVILRPMTAPRLRTFSEIARHLADAFPDTGEFPAPPPRPARHERIAPKI